MNISSKMRSISVLSYVIFFIAYFLIILLFAIKTIYYFSYKAEIWWLYLAATTISVFYLFLHSINNSGGRLYVMIIGGIIISFIPFEVELKRVFSLVFGSGIASLSGFAEGLPKPFGIIFDILLYPLLFSIPLVFMHWVLKKEVGTHGNKYRG